VKKLALPVLALWVGLVATMAWPAAGLPRAGTARPLQQGTTYVHVGTWPLPAGLMEPLDLAFGPRGDLYVADGYQRAVQAFRANGTQWASWPPPLIADGLVPMVVAYDGRRARLYTLWQLYARADGRAEPSPGPLYLEARTADGNPDGALQSLPFLSEAQDAAVDPTTGELLVLGRGLLYRVRLPAGLVGTVPVERSGQRPTRLAVLSDGRVVVGGGAYQGLTLFAANGVPLVDLALPEGDAVALAAVPGGAIHVLLRSPRPGAASAPLLMALDVGGGRLGRWSAADLSAPPVPAGAWPWALTAAAEGIAFTTGGSHLEIHSLAADVAPAWALAGRPMRTRFVAGDARRPSDPVLALALGTGGLEVLDAEAGAVLAFDPNGRASLVATVPEDAVDLAIDETGRRFVTTRDGWVEHLAPGDLITPTWREACGCDLGGRLAAGRGTVYASQPRTLSVGTMDAALGMVGRSYSLNDAVGLWPSDVALGPDGRLYTADLVTAQVHVWNDAGPPQAWPAGLLAGPRRIAAGHLADGTPALASVMADGSVALHTLDGNLVGRWEPRLATGASFAPVDVAMDAEGLVWLADARARAVYLFAPGGGVPATPLPAPTPAPTTDLTCRVQGGKVAGPDRLVLGQSVGVTLTLAASCPARASVLGADVMLVIDRSNSMSAGGLAAAQSAARSFVELLDVRYHRVGLTSFADDASVDVPLTSNVPAVIDGLRAVQTGGQTNLGVAIDRAWANLRDFGRPEALPVIVLLTDGQNSATAADPRPVAIQARNAGVQIYTIGLGNSVDQPLLRELAGRPDRFFFAPSPGDLFPVYGQILRLVLSSLAGNLIVDDLLGDGMAYVESSARPPAVVAFGRLSWGRSLLPATGITMTYQLRPTRAGCQPTNRQAVANYTDGDGALRQYVFPVPTVCVTAPTPTATRPPTATPTATPKPAHVYLPIAYKNTCIPGLARADVVLLIDTSDSMAGEKLARAKLAAGDFLDLLDYSGDQAAVLGFNASVQVASPLTASRPALTAALAHLTSAQGTQIDRALRAAINELRSVRHRRANRAVMVLLSDGYHNGDPRAVVAVADEARTDGMILFTIGLGQEFDADLLRAIAGPRRFYAAPDVANLSAIYREIAGVIPCR
jgi:Mg-chelatase subunit ChlD